ncbi:MAG TPA: glycosyltransferase family 39 protein [Candidatus Polarisedimenticolia bacterium]|nr:glycosyltransferase family 39 protein [Candidatus Polarisedimenticolia bacterium]
MIRLSSLPTRARDGFLIVLASLMMSGVFTTFVRPAWPPNDPDYDSFYRPLAQSILAGNGYRTSSGELFVVYPPGLSCVIAGIYWIAGATGSSEGVVLGLFNVLCSAVVALLIYLIGAWVFVRWAALAGALVWVAYPLQLWLVRLPNTEMPFMVLLFAAIYLVVRAGFRGTSLALASLSAGALIGVGSLFRPFGLLISLALVPFLWVSGERGAPATRRLLPCLLILLGNLATVLPWEGWVYRETGMVIPLSTNGRTAMLDGLTIDASPDLPGQVLTIPADVRRLLETVTARAEQLQSPGDVARFLLSDAKSHPLTAVKLILVKAVRALYATDSQRFERWVALLQLPFYLLALLGALRAWASGPAARRFLWLVVPLWVYSWAMTIMVLSIVRYMLPPFGLVSILVGIGICDLLGRAFPRLGLPHEPSRLNGVLTPGGPGS